VVTIEVAITVMVVRMVAVMVVRCLAVFTMALCRAPNGNLGTCQSYAGASSPYFLAKSKRKIKKVFVRERGSFDLVRMRRQSQATDHAQEKKVSRRLEGSTWREGNVLFTKEYKSKPILRPL
jgi:hypothetical protein